MSDKDFLKKIGELTSPTDRLEKSSEINSGESLAENRAVGTGSGLSASESVLGGLGTTGEQDSFAFEEMEDLAISGLEKDVDYVEIENQKFERKAVLISGIPVFLLTLAISGSFIALSNYMSQPQEIVKPSEEVYSRLSKQVSEEKGNSAKANDKANPTVNAGDDKGSAKTILDDSGLENFIKQLDQHDKKQLEVVSVNMIPKDSAEPQSSVKDFSLVIEGKDMKPISKAFSFANNLALDIVYGEVSVKGENEFSLIGNNSLSGTSLYLVKNVRHNFLMNEFTPKVFKDEPGGFWLGVEGVLNINGKSESAKLLVAKKTGVALMLVGKTAYEYVPEETK